MEILRPYDIVVDGRIISTRYYQRRLRMLRKPNVYGSIFVRRQASVFGPTWADVLSLPLPGTPRRRVPSCAEGAYWACCLA